MSAPRPVKTGSLLLAEPYLLDPNFKRAAIAVADHHADGTVGFVLNRPTEWRLQEIFEGFPDFDAPLFAGGPVQPDTLHFLHTLGDDVPESIAVLDGLAWGGSFEALTELVSLGLAGPADVKFFLGYSGWSPGQLEDELAEGTWLVGELTVRTVLQMDHAAVWPRSMRALGDVYGVLGQMDEEALN